MRFIHTSDWHLGNRLMDQSRHDEFAAFLEWLLGVMREKQAEALLVSGDIFDTSTPGNDTLALYYDFLSKADATGCRAIIITGGNHDGALQLQAPAPLLGRYHARVVSRLKPQDMPDCLVTLRNADGSPAALVCAIPYLREQDVALSSDSDDEEARNTAYVRGIAEVYKEAARLAQEWKAERPGLPAIAMGHLAAKGAEATKSTRRLIGKLDVVDCNIFSEVFDYVALGHIHKGYAMDNGRICYCGSPLAMGMDEAEYPHRVELVDISPQGLSVEHIETPRFVGFADVTCASADELAALPGKLREKYAAIGNRPIWLELVYTGGDMGGQALRERLQETLDSGIVPVLKARCDHGGGGIFEAAQEEGASLSFYSPENVFEMKLKQWEEANPLDDGKRTMLRELFQIVRNELQNTQTHED